MPTAAPVIRFAAVMQLRGINPYVLVSAARARKLKPGWRKPLPVLVQINGQPQTPWRINMMPVGDGRFYLYLHGDVRKASGTQVGDRVRVMIAYDPDYQSGPAPLPDCLRDPLRSHPQATKAWTALTPSRQKEIVRYLSALKSTDARARNTEKLLRMLETH